MVVNTSQFLDPSFWDHPTPTIVQWVNESQSRECSSAQGIITNGTGSIASDHVWLSCKTFIAHGRFTFNALGYVQSLTLEDYNYEALDGPNQDDTVNDDTDTNTTLYGHVGDGDYVRTPEGQPDELWFGLEGTQWPREVPAALVRYNAETLEFIAVHPYPMSNHTTMPWLAFDTAQKAAYSSNWTESNNELIVFNGTTLEWEMNKNIPICNIPPEYQEHGLRFVQGGAMDNLHAPRHPVRIGCAFLIRMTTMTRIPNHHPGSCTCRWTIFGPRC